uniref:Small ribosomal subunit protein uS11c n=1 Tax=Strelitzia reginae TaxID=255355 RepID=A0A3G2Z6N1_9LILI|nr:ribosomal protein S11 [Strelitzia reginae]
MLKPIPRIGLHRKARLSPRLRRIMRRVSRKHRKVRGIPKGIIHIQASWNNTIVTITDVRSQAVSWSSAGTCRFKGPRKGTPYAAQRAAVDAIHTLVAQGMRRAKVMIKGPGRGRDAALRAIRTSGIRLTCIRDVTPMPHNGCRPPKKRRV